MTGAPTDPQPPNSGNCHFCDSARIERAFFLHNETKTCFVCDACIVALFNELLTYTGGVNPYHNYDGVLH